VDWCESHKEEVIRVNVTGALLLADICLAKGIHHTMFGTGCVYDYDEEHKMGSGKGFSEEEPHNYSRSFYSKTKGMVQEVLQLLSCHQRPTVGQELTRGMSFTAVGLLRQLFASASADACFR